MLIRFYSIILTMSEINEKNVLIQNSIINNFKRYVIKKINFNIYNKIKIFMIQIILIYIIIDLLNKIKNYNTKKNKNFNNIKVCICTLGKQENKYIKEFVEYYKNYGVDKIILYDNNDLNGERFEEVISDYINNKFVEISNWRGKKMVQFKIMNNCYQNNYKIFDWLIFYDIDEFIFLKNFSNIKEFLYQPKFDKCGRIELNWIHRVNETALYYENRPLLERFPYKENNIINHKTKFYPQIKSILKGHIPNIDIICLHKLTSQVIACDGFGRKSRNKGIKSIRPDYEYYYINHYYGKSLEEFVEKIKKGCAVNGKNEITMMAKINRYFEIYKMNKEKINYIEKHTGLNLTKLIKN